MLTDKLDESSRLAILKNMRLVHIAGSLGMVACFNPDFTIFQNPDLISHYFGSHFCLSFDNFRTSNFSVTPSKVPFLGEHFSLSKSSQALNEIVVGDGSDEIESFVLMLGSVVRASLHSGMPPTGAAIQSIVDEFQSIGGIQEVIESSWHHSIFSLLWDLSLLVTQKSRTSEFQLFSDENRNYDAKTGNISNFIFNIFEKINLSNECQDNLIFDFLKIFFENFQTEFSNFWEIFIKKKIVNFLEKCEIRFWIENSNPILKCLAALPSELSKIGESFRSPLIIPYNIRKSFSCNSSEVSDFRFGANKEFFVSVLFGDGKLLTEFDDVKFRIPNSKISGLLEIYLKAHDRETYQILIGTEWMCDFKTSLVQATSGIPIGENAVLLRCPFPSSFLKISEIFSTKSQDMFFIPIPWSHRTTTRNAQGIFSSDFSIGPIRSCLKNPEAFKTGPSFVGKKIIRGEDTPVSGEKYFMTICAFAGNFLSEEILLQWLEYHRILGIEKIRLFVSLGILEKLKNSLSAFVQDDFLEIFKEFSTLSESMTSCVLMSRGDSNLVTFSLAPLDFLSFGNMQPDLIDFFIKNFMRNPSIAVMEIPRIPFCGIEKKTEENLIFMNFDSRLREPVEEEGFGSVSGICSFFDRFGSAVVRPELVIEVLEGMFPRARPGYTYLDKVPASVVRMNFYGSESIQETSSLNVSKHITRHCHSGGNRIKENPDKTFSWLSEIKSKWADEMQIFRKEKQRVNLLIKEREEKLRKEKNLTLKQNATNDEL